MKINRYNACNGLCKTTIIKLGIAPINGPNTGITFVTPTITATSTADGILSIRQPIYAIIPIMMESMIFPVINPPKISLAF